MSQSIPASEIKTIIFACEAGMGSSLMSVNALKKKLVAAHVFTKINVIYKPVREIPSDAQLVIVHKGLAKVARMKAPKAVIVAFFQFVNDPVFDEVVKAIAEGREIVSTEP